jgi:hypothetical protein
MNGAGSHPRLRVRPHRPDHRERGALHPGRAVRALARNGAHQRRRRAPATASGFGLGEAIGPHDRAEEGFPHRDISVLAAGVRPAGTGHRPCRHRLRHHPSSTPTATEPPWGKPPTATSSAFTHAVTRLEGGVFLNVGTAVMGPEVYLKALAMARNVAHQQGRLHQEIHHRRIRSHPAGRTTRTASRPGPIRVTTTAPGRPSWYAPSRTAEPATMSAVRMTSTVPALYHAILQAEARTMKRERLASLLAGFADHRIAVCGDFFLDTYLELDPRLNEPSIETGKTAYQVVGKRNQPGAGGTVCNNLAALGIGTLQALTVVGDDGEGYELRKALQRRQVAIDTVFADSARFTPTYTKPMLQGPEGEEELNRLDVKNRCPLPPRTETCKSARPWKIPWPRSTPSSSPIRFRNGTVVSSRTPFAGFWPSWASAIRTSSSLSTRANGSASFGMSRSNRTASRQREAPPGNPRPMRRSKRRRSFTTKPVEPCFSHWTERASAPSPILSTNPCLAPPSPPGSHWISSGQATAPPRPSFRHWLVALPKSKPPSWATSWPPSPSARSAQPATATPATGAGGVGPVYRPV